MFEHPKERTTLEDYLNQLYGQHADEERADVFANAFPPNFVYYSLNATQLAEPQALQSVKISGTPIRKLVLMLEDDKEIGTKDNNSALYIKFENGERKVISIDKEEEKALRDLFVENAAIKEKMFSRKSRTHLPWDKLEMDVIYRSQTRHPDIYYNALHDEMVAHVIPLISKLNTPVAIVDGGCGDQGSFLLKMEKGINENNIPHAISLMGFDFNSENIKKCKKITDTNCQFMTGDLKKTNNTVDEWMSKNQMDKTIPVILTLSGSLTRLVLENGFEGLKALKSIATQGHIEYLMGGGVGEPLVNNFIMKHMGYQRLATESKDEAFFYYHKMSEEDVLKYRLKRLTKYGIIDLSLCPNPLALFDKLVANVDTRQPLILDLSFTDLNETLIARIKTFLDKHNNVSLVFWHNDPNQVAKFSCGFIEEKGANYPVSSLKLVDDEGYLMSSRLFLSSLHSHMNRVESLSLTESHHENDLQNVMTKILDLNISDDMSQYLVANYVYKIAGDNKDDNAFFDSIKLFRKSINWVPADNELFVEYINNDEITIKCRGVDPKVIEYSQFEALHQKFGFSLNHTTSNTNRECIAAFELASGLSLVSLSLMKKNRISRNMQENICLYFERKPLQLSCKLDRYGPYINVNYINVNLNSRADLEKYLNDYVENLEKLVFEDHKIASLPHLLTAHQIQLEFSCEEDLDDGTYTEHIFSFDRNILKEIELYHRLATSDDYKKFFGMDFAKKIAEHRINEFKPKNENERILLNQARDKMGELFGAQSNANMRMDRP